MRPRSRCNHTSSEPYNPHYLPRQFGLVQRIPLPYESDSKFDEWVILYVNKLVDWELNSNERINNFYFEKFKIAPLTTLELALWWEAQLKKLLGQPLSVLLPKFKQMGAFALALHSSTLTGKEAISIFAHGRASFTKVASASKSEYPSHFLLPCILLIDTSLLLLFPYRRSSQEI